VNWPEWDSDEIGRHPKLITPPKPIPRPRDGVEPVGGTSGHQQAKRRARCKLLNLSSVPIGVQLLISVERSQIK